ncbi:hypothetical protein [Aquimarina sp. AU119]|uniref:hypothetical protein n=1 Tax=Aquimarina sp. AU119 TaxID=2108528 RepID=UPI000D6881C8|nr:hypothetical protein [Aquimarina sp. AU119]
MVQKSESNKGIDKSISDIQDVLKREFISKWKDFDIYGKIYKNVKDKKNIMEVYQGNGEYKPLYFNKDKTATVFFIDSDSHSTQDELVYTSDLKIVFVLNLSQIYNSRKDSDAHSEVVNTIRNKTFGNFEIKEIQKGYKNILSNINNESFVFSDIHPYHMFSVNGKITYYLKDC